ncbi:MAG: hypothetical protein AB7G37_14670, partial [Solirubrobacteraceae bacterium]
MSARSLRPSRAARLIALIPVLALGGVLAGCGDEPAEESTVRVLVTTDGGATVITDERGVERRDGDHALDVLRRVTKVEASGDGTVRAIDGRSGKGGPWTLWINGLSTEAGDLDDRQQSPDERPPRTETAGQAEVDGGDTVWFDLPSTTPIGTPRGVVGTFPEPFLHGAGGGKRWPVRVECIDPRGQACRQVRDAVSRYGLPVATTTLLTQDAGHTARIAVGPWSRVRADPAARLLEGGPRTSGAWLRPKADGRSIDLLDASGETA